MYSGQVKTFPSEDETAEEGEVCLRHGYGE